MNNYEISYKGRNAEHTDWFTYTVEAETEFGAIAEFVKDIKKAAELLDIHLVIDLPAHPFSDIVSLAEEWRWQENDWLMEFRGIRKLAAITCDKCAGTGCVFG